MFVFSQIHMLDLYHFSFRLLGIELWDPVVEFVTLQEERETARLHSSARWRLYQKAAISNEISSETSYSSILMADTEK